MFRLRKYAAVQIDSPLRYFEQGALLVLVGVCRYYAIRFRLRPTLLRIFYHRHNSLFPRLRDPLLFL